MIKKKSESKTLQNFVKYSTLAFQMLGFMVVLGFCGYWLDQKYKTDPSYFTIFGLLLGVVLASIYIIKSLLSDQKKDV